jgi:hypothetical protein
LVFPVHSPVKGQNGAHRGRKGGGKRKTHAG